MADAPPAPPPSFLHPAALLASQSDGAPLAMSEVTSLVGKAYKGRRGLVAAVLDRAKPVRGGHGRRPSIGGGGGGSL